MGVVLGVLPLLPLALHFWFLGHVPSAAVLSPVVTAAEKMVFVCNGQLDFAADLITLKEAYAGVDSSAGEDAFDVNLAYGHLVRSIA